MTSEWTTSCIDQLKDAAQCDAHPLAHVVGTSEQDELHVLVSLWDSPSCLLLQTPIGAKLSIDWARLVEKENQTGAISVDKVLTSYGFSLDQVSPPLGLRGAAVTGHRSLYCLQELLLRGEWWTIFVP